MHGSAVHTAHTRFRAYIQTDHVGELRPQLICVGEEIFLVANDKNSQRQDRQCRNNESSESRRS